MIRRIEIPKRLSEKLESDKKWSICVEKVNQNVADYFFRTPYFFPEYTDHGVLHIEKVLEICDKLITDKSMEILKAKEIAVTIISIMIHDIGMFIQKDGLRELIYGSFKDGKIEYLDQHTWGEAWQSYIRRARRYSEKKLLEIFGDSEPIKVPDEKMKNLDEKTILLYGDFLRMQHGRLAHTIAREGFLGDDNLDIFRGTDMDNSMKDIIGLTARSHCMSLRDCKEYLESRFSEFETPKNVRIFYIMVLLRIGDYLDAGYDRASHVISSMQKKRSSISKEEYSWNAIIDYDDYKWHFDQCKLSIHAEPRNSDEFLKIEDWLKNVQKEIDMSWAVLGECYGSQTGMGISIRRIESNILKRESRKSFERKFVTRRAVLDTNPDILGLLILPLYDNDPRYGIREILQNAIDACKERTLLEERKGNRYSSLIKIFIDTQENTVVISDNGTGMDEDIIINYFLISGASFRNSEEWSRHFMSDDKSLVSRTGRFGIGALAIFLIGGQATITTRKARYETDEGIGMGYKFDLRVSNENISIDRVKTDIGTQIEIKTTPEVIEKITETKSYPNWFDWYCFDEPQTHYYLDGREVFHEEEYVPDEKEEFDKWFQLDVSEFRSFKWSYEHPIVDGINSYCNGIPIPKRCILSGAKYGFDLADPVISLVDFNNRAKINLSRSQLSEFPCEEEFIVEGYKYALAKLLSLPDILNSTAFWELYENGFPLCKEFGFNKRTSEITPGEYLANKSGYMLMSPAFLYNAKVDKIHVIFVKSDYLTHCEHVDVDEPVNICCIGKRKRRTFFMDIFDGIFEEDYIKEIPIKFEVEKNFFDVELKDLFEKAGIMDRLELHDSNHAYYNFTTDQCHSKECAMTKQSILGEENQKYILAEMTYKITYKDHHTNTMIEMLNQYMNQGWIPFKSEERKEKFHDTFEKLGMYF